MCACLYAYVFVCALSMTDMATTEAESPYHICFDDAERYQEVMDAAESDDVEKKKALAWFMITGRGGAKKDPEGAVALLRKIAEKNWAAEFLVGYCQEFGVGCERKDFCPDSKNPYTSKFMFRDRDSKVMLRCMLKNHLIMEPYLFLAYKCCL